MTEVQLKRITVETLPDGTSVCREYCNDTDNLNDCKIVPCPESKKLKLDSNCPVPDCTNEEIANMLWPVNEDAASFYQCPAIGSWDPVKTHCGCETVFSYEKQQCIYPFEWTKDCFRHPDKPEVTHCVSQTQKLYKF